MTPVKSNKAMALENEKDCLITLKKLIKDDNELKEFELNDTFLLHFIRGRKYNPTKAFETLQKYIHVRREIYPNFFNNIRPQTCKGLEERVIRCFQSPDKLNRRIGIVRTEWWNPNKITFDDVLTAALFFFEEAWNNKDIEIDGIIAILDCEGFSLKHLTQCSLSQLNKMHEIFWNAFPLRFKTVYIVNEPIYFKMVYALCYPFIPPKLRSRTFFYGRDRKSLHKTVPPEMLPKSLGGYCAEDDETIWDNEFAKRILNKGDYYEDFLKI